MARRRTLTVGPRDKEKGGSDWQEKLKGAVAGFSGSYFPASFQMQELERRKLFDRQRRLTDIGKEIREGFLTPEDLDKYHQELVEIHDMSPEDAALATASFLPTEQQRTSEAIRRAGPTLERTQAGLIRHAKDVGAEGIFEQYAPRMIDVTTPAPPQRLRGLMDEFGGRTPVAAPLGWRLADSPMDAGFPGGFDVDRERAPVPLAPGVRLPEPTPITRRDLGTAAVDPATGDWGFTGVNPYSFDPVSRADPTQIDALTSRVLGALPAQPVRQIPGEGTLATQPLLPAGRREWGGPLAEQMQEEEKQALAREMEREKQKSTYAGERAATIFEKTAEAEYQYARENFDDIQQLQDDTGGRETQRRIQATLDELNHKKLQDLKISIQVALLNNLPLTQAQQNHMRAMDVVRLEMAVNQAELTDEAQFYYPYNLKTKETDVYVVHFDKKQKKRVISTLYDFPDMPEELKPHVRESVPYSPFYRPGEEQGNDLLETVTNVLISTGTPEADAAAKAADLIRERRGGVLGPGADGPPVEDIEEITNRLGMNQEGITDAETGYSPQTAAPPFTLTPAGRWKTDQFQAGADWPVDIPGIEGADVRDLHRKPILDKIERLRASVSAVEDELADAQEMKGAPRGLLSDIRARLVRTRIAAQDLIALHQKELAEVDQWWEEPSLGRSPLSVLPQ